MKTMIVAAIFMSVCFGISHTLKSTTASNATSSISIQSGASEDLIQSSQQQLKQELAQSVQSLTRSVKQTSGAVVDVASSVIAYVFLSVGQGLASIVLDRK